MTEGLNVDGAGTMESIEALPRVLLAEPHDLYRMAYTDVLSAPDSGFSLTDGCELQEDVALIARRLEPDIALICTHDAVDLSAIRRISVDLPKTAVVAISSKENGGLIVEAIRAGARAFLPKSVSGRRLLNAMLRVLDGEIFVDPTLAGNGVVWAAQRLDPEQVHDPLGSLTTREREVVTLLAEGLGASAIAARLFVSPRTVEGHLAKAYRKLGAHNAIEAIRSVMRAQAVH